MKEARIGFTVVVLASTHLLMFGALAQLTFSFEERVAPALFALLAATVVASTVGLTALWRQELRARPFLRRRLLAIVLLCTAPFAPDIWIAFGLYIGPPVDIESVASWAMEICLLVVVGASFVAERARANGRSESTLAPTWRTWLLAAPPTAGLAIVLVAMAQQSVKI